MALESKSHFIKCGLCGTLTTSGFGYGVCHNCVEEDQRLYAIAKKAMKPNQVVGLADLCKQTGIEAKIIQRWVDTGRLKAGA